MISASELVVMRWDPQKCGSGISLSNDNFTAFLKESAYMFRTVFANVVTCASKAAADVRRTLLGDRG